MSHVRYVLTIAAISAMPSVCVAQKATITENKVTLDGVSDKELNSNVIKALKKAADKYKWDVGQPSVENAKQLPATSGAATQLRVDKLQIPENSFLFVYSADRVQKLETKDIDLSGGTTSFFPPGEVTIAIINKGGENKSLKTQDLDVRVLSTPAQNKSLSGEAAVPVPQRSLDDATPRPEMVCGEDDRTRSTDRRVGRILPALCTGWLVDNKYALTAGHCIGGLNVIEFDVPSSQEDGTLVPAAPDNQYPIISSSVVYEKPGGAEHPCIPGTFTCNVANDWALIELGPNSNTGIYPGDARGGFFKLKKPPIDLISRQVSIYGYGQDEVPRSSTLGGLNSDSYTLQVASGPIKEIIGDPSHSSGSYITYRVDAESGSSGSPILLNIGGNEFAIGIHGSGGCRSSTLRVNYGITVDDRELVKALSEKPQIKVE